MTFRELYTSAKNFIKAGLSDNGSISSKRGVLWYTAIVIWTFINVSVFLSPTMDKERDSLIFYNFWIIVSGTGMVLGEKFINRTPKL
jgi:hypothetical protein